MVMIEQAALYAKLKSRLLPVHTSEPVDEGMRQAAVAVVLRACGALTELLVIRRAVSERDHWSGHLALPGGRKDAADANLCETAIRETREEVGIDLREGGEVLGRLPTVTPKSSLAPQVAVTPFVAVAPPAYHSSDEASMPKELRLNEEVAAAFWVPLRLLKESGRSERFTMVIMGVNRAWPAYPSAEGLIWGLTERILTGFLSLLD